VRDVVIENPVINSAFAEPRQHFKFDDDGITSEVVEQRRPSAYFIPVAPPKKKGAQLQLGTEWTEDRLRENDYINEVRGYVRTWRDGGYPGITRTTRQLLEYWQRPGRDRRLFFCQIEAVETAIYLTEVAERLGRPHLLTVLKHANEAANPGLDRLAFKMATGSGKTVVMAMLIAWHALNKIEDPQDARFTDSFLIVTPGITIRDRLRVLLPNDAENYYRKLDVVPVELMERLNRAQIVITNFHAFLRREKVAAGKLTKRLLAGRSADERSPFTETPDEMVRRVSSSVALLVDVTNLFFHLSRPDGAELRNTMAKSIHSSGFGCIMLFAFMVNPALQRLESGYIREDSETVADRLRCSLDLAFPSGEHTVENPIWPREG
jgi:type III restriction enzyme